MVWTVLSLSCNPFQRDQLKSIRCVCLQDGDFVVVHTDYNFFGPKVGFDIFRFEDGKIVEHWDNLQATGAKPSPSGHTMIDGPTRVSDLDKTEANKTLMQTY